MGASFVRHPAASSHGQNRTGREDGGNGKCGGSAPQGWKPYLSLGSAATGPPAFRSVRFDQAANGCGVMNKGCLGRWSGGKPDRAAFVAKRRIPEGGVSTWCRPIGSLCKHLAAVTQFCLRGRKSLSGNNGAKSRRGTAIVYFVREVYFSPGSLEDEAAVQANCGERLKEPTSVVLIK